jgi:U3 small nucleolar RNA-associated protein 6
MADVVRQLMEGMLPELQALVDKGIINADELRAIIKKREAFEYKLAKRSTELPDYIAAIKYEMLLQQLVKDRKAQLGIKKQHRLIDFGRQVAPHSKRSPPPPHCSLFMAVAL